jgi:hypothetical protein
MYGSSTLKVANISFNDGIQTANKIMFNSLLVVKMAKVPYLDEPAMRVALPTDVRIIHVIVTAHCKILVQVCGAVNSFLQRNWTPGSSPNWTTSKKHWSPCNGNRLHDFFLLQEAQNHQGIFPQMYY